MLQAGKDFPDLVSLSNKDSIEEGPVIVFIFVGCIDNNRGILLKRLNLTIIFFSHFYTFWRGLLTLVERLKEPVEDFPP